MYEQSYWQGQEARMITCEDVFRAQRRSEHRLELKDPKCPIIIALETVFSPPIKPNDPGRVLNSGEQKC